MSDIHPEGTFQARCKQWSIAETKDGKPQVFLSFEEADGRTITSFKSLSEKALPYTLKTLRNCGYAGNDIINDLERADCGLDKNQVEIVVEHETYEGKVRAKVGFVNLPGAGVTPLDPAKKASFAQEMKARVLALEMGQPKAKAVVPPGPVDINF